MRHGCPLSPFLFIISIEILSHIIRYDTDIKGVKLVSDDIKNTMFADDATFITDGSESSIKAIINDIDRFSMLSGLKLNRKKTVIMRCGSLKNTNFTCCIENQFNWTSDKASTLGMIFSNNKYEIEKNNLLPKIEQFFGCLER